MDISLKNLIPFCVIFLFSSAVAASDVRKADGKPCYETEKTYYDKDGITPHSCLSSGGPAYTFTVYVGPKVLWEGSLEADDAAVYFDLPDEKTSGSRLVVKRDLNADPTGRVLFFGQESLVAVESYKVGDAVVQAPVIKSVGISIRSGSGKETTNVGNIVGSDVDFTNYRFSITPSI